MEGGLDLIEMFQTMSPLGIAVAVILFILCFVVALAYQRWVMRRDTEGATTYG